ncbi:GNAT family N-acetyltransferase [Streptantibioticus ferralitis]|uniref:GNAT family N-acetyltransferase n=1 Tax=Streptantibioticus ferralitis TaxID=236510 RepID=A0ABT5YSI5_9ACTN|nr:GNAT family N-acetyltransferase [Streptantibioticus ferralitis]MDF2254572.1 GNAT family N-acetyltransferase [Streptantibioticus ferralitis]
MIRAASPADIPAIHSMIRELAEYERSLEDARATPEQLREALFGAHPAAFALIAHDVPAAQQADGGVPPRAVGFALWFRNFSTWTGTHGVYLEDLYVRPEARGAGHGKALLAELARICVERGYERFEWSVLDWNEPSIGFYKSLGAVSMDEWTVHRLTGEPLRALASSATLASPNPNGAIPLSN